MQMNGLSKCVVLKKAKKDVFAFFIFYFFVRPKRCRIFK